MTESLISIIAWLGGACFCGILPLGFAAILFFTARKRSRVGNAVGLAKKGTVASLVPGTGLVRVQGTIAATENALDGSADNALVYLRLKVEIYERDSDSSGWRGLTDKARGIPFQVNDGSGSVWTTPEGLDKQLLGDGFTPTDDQIQAACILLGISPGMLRGQLRFTLWEVRSGQTVSIVGTVIQVHSGLEISSVQGQPFVISLLLGPALDAKISSQTKVAHTWTYVLGIPGLLFLLCGLVGALVSLVRVLMNQ
jgi:hypothetical protein